MNGGVKMDKVYYVTILTTGFGPNSDRIVKENVRLDYQTLDLIIKSERVWFDEKGHSVASVHIGLENDATIYISS